MCTSILLPSDWSNLAVIDLHTLTAPRAKALHADEGGQKNVNLHNYSRDILLLECNSRAKLVIDTYVIT